MVKTRSPSTGLITLFLDDSSFSELCLALQNEQREKAFLAAHALKGFCANLGFDQLGASASKLTELLRPKSNGVPEDAVFILNEVKQDYESAVSAIRAYLDLESRSE